MENGKKFREMITVICERYEKEPSELLTKMIWKTLKKYSDNDCIAAFNHVFRYGKFFKDIVPDLLDFLEKLNPAPEIQDIATIEADKIISHLKFYGASKLPQIDNPVSKYLMKNRWNYRKWAANILEKEIVWWKKEFIESFKSFQKVENLELIEKSNKALGLLDNILKKV